MSTISEIVDILREGPLPVFEIATRLGMRRCTLQQRLALMKIDGIVDVVRSRVAVYSLTENADDIIARLYANERFNPIKCGKQIRKCLLGGRARSALVRRIHAIREAYIAGFTLEEIGKQVGLNQSSVRSVLIGKSYPELQKDLPPIKMRSIGNRKRNEDWARQVWDMRRKGLAWTVIAKHFGVDRSTARESFEKQVKLLGWLKPNVEKPIDVETRIRLRESREANLA